MKLDAKIFSYVHLVLTVMKRNLGTVIEPDLGLGQLTPTHIDQRGHQLGIRTLAGHVRADQLWKSSAENEHMQLRDSQRVIDRKSAQSHDFPAPSKPL